MARIDLDTLAQALAIEDGRRAPVSLAQIKELLGALGRRWRRIGPLRAALEFAALYRRAGRGRSSRADLSRARPRRRPF